MKFIFALFLLSISASVPNAEQICGLNERYNECGSACPVHCPVRNKQTGELEDGSRQACILICKQGCECAPGFVRDLKRDGACVEKANCTPADQPKVKGTPVIAEKPTCTRANEVYLNCGTACPETCPYKDEKTGQLNDGKHQICNKMCKVGCACAHGFVRDLKQNGECVERALCTPP